MTLEGHYDDNMYNTTSHVPMSTSSSSSWLAAVRAEATLAMFTLELQLPSLSPVVVAATAAEASSIGTDLTTSGLKFAAIECKLVAVKHANTKQLIVSKKSNAISYSESLLGWLAGN